MRSESQLHRVPEPSHAYLDALNRQTEQRKSAAQHQLADSPGAPEDLVDAIEQAVDQQGQKLVEILHDLHEHPELAYQEHHAAQQLVAHLESHGISAESPVFGLETAIRAEIAAPDFDPETDRTVAILSEYDALPEIGHGCGHNVIAVTGLGAFTALGQLLREQPDRFRGRVVYLGTPAEEGHGGKEVMARAGAFDDVDAAVMTHPYFADAADVHWLGRRGCRVEFTGLAAHASAHPFLGRNALDAASLAYQGLGLLRQQTPPTDRIHAVLPQGGERPNVIPESAVLELYVRSQLPETLKVLSDRVVEVMQGAALMAGVGVRIHWDESPATLPVLGNRALSDRWVLAQRRRGREPLPAGTISEVFAASTDFGNVSYRIPGIHPMLGISAEDVGLHTREFAHAAASPAAERAAADGAFGLAAAALDYLDDDDLAAAVRQEFETDGGGVDVASYFD